MAVIRSILLWDFIGAETWPKRVEDIKITSLPSVLNINYKYTYIILYIYIYIIFIFGLNSFNDIF